MIDHEHKCIFIHQRKCAGMAVMKSFGMVPENPDYHYMNDGVLSPEYHTRPMDYFRFATVRNPWDRFISGWLFCEGTKHRPMRDVLRSLPRLEHDYSHLTRLQHSILYDRAGYLVVEKTMHFESLQQDFDEVCDAIGKPRTIIERINTNDSRRHYREYFTDPIDVDLFLRHFALDVDTFEYEF